MPVKILHAADFHMDSPFGALSEEKAAIRRREQRELLTRISEIAAAEKVQIILLAGDLLDSSATYGETCDGLMKFFTQTDAKIFIAPGNHDYYCQKSPYAYLKLPENVFVFKTPTVRSFIVPELNCRIWGAGFTAPGCLPILRGFRNIPTDSIDMMVIHGEIGGETYNPMDEKLIADSCMDYMALGHVHTYSGIQKAGNTFYAYPGCPEGRGFDETGEKGVIVGTVDKGEVDLHFVPTSDRKYEILTTDVTGCTDITSKVLASLPGDTSRDIYRLILTGETDTPPDIKLITEKLGSKFFQLTVRDKTRELTDIWQGSDEETLRGLFLKIMREKYDNAEPEEQEQLMKAVRLGIAAIDNREADRI